MILKNYRYFSTKPWKGMAHVLRPNFFVVKNNYFLGTENARKRQITMFRFFSTSEMSEEKKYTHTFTMRRFFQDHVFNYPRR